MAAPTWADNTTQDRLEKIAEEKGWKVLTSTSTQTVLKRWPGTLTVNFETREQNGQIRTVVHSLSLEIPHDSFNKFDHAVELLDLLGNHK
ncbi:hypothetical protein HWB99_gp065 [Mycobacterium phage DrLupo]|uniref:Uncharacterized protein n=1 Tax=Mycobacterium phage DrLupo TaxID=2499037 RepID=A0A3S9UQN5_9CAUD|nr:hypothetical protein HWB99_gp065 [Mycobacterium phage DrLupo]AZS12601.1 hypothetical protein SEA_DRLUPO_65 [Mycobacterium phage DrLupo]